MLYFDSANTSLDKALKFDMAALDINPPKVFISYSHDSHERLDRVLALADRLREEGIDCNLDQYEFTN